MDSDSLQVTCVVPTVRLLVRQGLRGRLVRIAPWLARRGLRGRLARQVRRVQTARSLALLVRLVRQARRVPLGPLALRALLDRLVLRAQIVRSLGLLGRLGRRALLALRGRRVRLGVLGR